MNHFAVTLYYVLQEYSQVSRHWRGNVRNQNESLSALPQLQGPPLLYWQPEIGNQTNVFYSTMTTSFFMIAYTPIQQFLLYFMYITI